MLDARQARDPDAAPRRRESPWPPLGCGGLPLRRLCHRSPRPAADLEACDAKREKAIHEPKEDVGIDRISSSAFWADAANLELKVLAFNLLVLYHRQALGWTSVHRAQTARRRLTAVAGRLGRSAAPITRVSATHWSSIGRSLAPARAGLSELRPALPRPFLRSGLAGRRA